MFFFCNLVKMHATEYFKTTNTPHLKYFSVACFYHIITFPNRQKTLYSAKTAWTQERCMLKEKRATVTIQAVKSGLLGCLPI